MNPLQRNSLCSAYLRDTLLESATSCRKFTDAAKLLIDSCIPILK